MNNLTVLIPALIAAIQSVARQTGFIFNLADVDATAQTAGLNQTINLPSLPAIAAADVTPGVDAAEASGQTAVAEVMTLNKHKKGVFKLTAEDYLAMRERGEQFKSINIESAVSAVIGAAAADLALEMELNAGLAHGTPGTDPFASTPNILVDAWRTMADDLCPDLSRYAALSTVHYGSAAKLPQFQKLNEAPSGTVWAQGRLGMLANWNTGYDQASGVLQTTTAAGGYLVNNGAGYPVGATAITVDTGTGGFAAGDVITIAGSFETGTATLAQYVVKSATATVITLTRGLITAVADNASVVRIATHRSSILAHPSATAMAFRPSAELPEGDKATIRQVVRDPVTGLALRLAYYPMYHQGQWEVSAVYGMKVRRSAWIRRIIS